MTLPLSWTSQHLKHDCQISRWYIIGMRAFPVVALPIGTVQKSEATQILAGSHT